MKDILNDFLKELEKKKEKRKMIFSIIYLYIFLTFIMAILKILNGFNIITDRQEGIIGLILVFICYGFFLKLHIKWNKK